jgi:hypothetical protein
MTHTHTIDGKVITADDNTCTICHPAATTPTAQEKEEILPRAYRTSQTVVLKITKGRMATLNFWQEGGLYLHTVQHIVTDSKGNAILDEVGKAVWQKDTLRIPPVVLREYLNLCSILYNEIEHQGTVPKRD